MVGDLNRYFMRKTVFLIDLKNAPKNERVGAIIKRFNSPGLIGWDLEILEALGPIS
mgnify:FL=1